MAPPLLDVLPLSSFASGIEAWMQTRIHDVYMPVGLLALLHAIRVSHATRQVHGGTTSSLTAWQSTVLDIVLLFGAVVVSSILLALPCPLLFSGDVIALYAGTHLVLWYSGIGNVLLRLNEDKAIGFLMDLTFTLLDALFRADGIATLGVDTIRTHPLPSLSTSLLAQLLNGAIIGGATPFLIHFFTLSSPRAEWGWSSKWLPRRFDVYAEAVSGAGTAAVYGFVLEYSDTAMGRGKEGKGEAKAAATLFLASILVAQVGASYVRSSSFSSSSSTASSSSSSSLSGKKKKSLKSTDTVPSPPSIQGTKGGEGEKGKIKTKRKGKKVHPNGTAS